MNRFKIAQYIALVATALSVIGWLLWGVLGSQVGLTMIGIGALIGIVSYVFGGILTAFKMACGIAKWGWFVLPFPYGIVTFIGAFAIAIYVFICFPIIPVRKAYTENVI